MSHPVRAIRLTALTLALAALVAITRADDQPAPGRMVTKVYPVADLVVPINDAILLPQTCNANGACPAQPCCADRPTCPLCSACPQTQGQGAAVCQPATPTCEKTLIRTVIHAVTPASWTDVGGSGTIEYFPIGKALVVNQTPGIQEQVADLLERLRRLQDREIALEVRFLTVPDHCLGGRVGVDFEGQKTAQMCGNQMLQAVKRADGRPTIVCDQQVKQLLGGIVEDCQTNVMQAPKLTLFNGQRSSVRVTDDQFFVTSVEPQQVNGQTVFVPQNTPITLGMQMTACPKLSPDGKVVHCDLKAEVSTLTSPNVPMFPVTTFVTPTFEGGAQGQPIPFTQFVQQPNVSRLVIDKALTIPDGNTAILYAGERTRKQTAPKAEDAAPLFSWVSELVEFLAPPPPPTTVHEHMFVLVTPHVIVNTDDVAAKPAPEVLPMPKVVRMPAEEEQAAPQTKPTTCPVCPACPACPAGASCPGCAMCAPPPVKAPVPPCADECPTQVSMQAFILRVNPSFFDRPEGVAWCDLSPKACDGKPCFLSDAEAQRFCKALQAHNCADMLSRPQIMCLSGSTASVQIGNEQVCTTGVTIVTREDGTTTPAFRTEKVQHGIRMQATPTVSADGKCIQLALHCEISNPSPSDLPKMTITTKDGTDEIALALSRPDTHVQKIDAKVCVPVGRTMLHYICDKNGQCHAVLVTPQVHGPVPCEGTCPASTCPATAALTCPTQPSSATCPAPSCPVTAPLTCPTPVCVPMPVPLTWSTGTCVPVVPAHPMAVAPVMPMARFVAPLPPAMPMPVGPQVQLDACLFAVAGSYFDRDDAVLWAKRALQGCCKEPVLIDGGEMAKFVEVVRNNGCGKLIAHPKLVAMSGRPATFLADGRFPCPTSVRLVERNGKLVPEVETSMVGNCLETTFVPIVRSREQIHLEMATSLSALPPRDVLIPVTGEFNLPVARPLVPPGFQADRVHTAIQLRPGQAVLRSLGQQPVAAGDGSLEMQHLYVLVTPQLVESMPVPVPPQPVRFRVFEQQVAPPAQAADPRLPMLLAHYHAACATGDMAAARLLAVQCLEIDPTCFGK